MKTDLEKACLVIQVGGTSYSGSTLLDLMLSNAEDAFSCGEVYAMFRPHRPHHFDPECSCADPACRVWPHVKEQGEPRLWKSLRDLFPQVRIFVDSSKRVDWFLEQRALHRNDPVRFLNVLIWKPASAYALSCMKRGELRRWRRTYLNYHIAYFQKMKPWVSVNYAELVKNPARKLQALCASIGLTFFPGKEHYWNKVHHTLFGSNSAKLHLYDKDSVVFSRILKDRATHKSMGRENRHRAFEHHRSLFFEEDSTERLPKGLLYAMKRDPLLSKVEAILQATEIERDEELRDMNATIRALPLVGRLNLRDRIHQCLCVMGEAIGG